MQMDVRSSFTGKYAQTSSDGLDQYMKAIGVGFTLRQAFAKSSVDFELLHDGNGWTIRSVSLVKSWELTFQDGVQKQWSRIDGAEVTGMLVFEGNLLIERQTDQSGSVSTIVRDFSHLPVMTETLTVGDVVANRIYEKE